MSGRVHQSPNLIYSPGTQVVLRRAVGPQPAGAVGTVVQSPVDLDHDYRVRFADAGG